MKQIIVNVSGLSLEEKQRVNEALAKIMGVRQIPNINPRAGWFFAPASSGTMVVTWSFPSEPKTPTHTPQQVLEMAGMIPAAEHIILADTLIITDSSGNIVYDSTPDSLNNFIKQRANGVSVKLDKNGAAVMVEKRKVRKDFDPTKEYSVDVSKCTEDEKKEVQQAFFDAGIEWGIEGKEYKRLHAVQYTNTTVFGHIKTYLMYSTDTNRCNMTDKEFLALVYEPEQQGHVHSHLMAQYAYDAKTSKTPWELWEYLDKDDGWTTHRGAPGWYETSEYRRKPKTHIVHGVEIPDLRVTPELGDKYYLADPASRTFFTHQNFVEHRMEKLWVERGLTYQDSEEGKQAAILHTRAMLGMVQ